MQVNGLLFQEILASLNHTLDDGGIDQRRTPRVRVGSEVQMLLCAESSGQPHAVRMHDISAGGMSLFFHRKLCLDEELIIQFPRTDAEPIAILGQVAYYEPLSPVLYRVGLKFTRVLSGEEVAGVNEPVGAGSPEPGVVGRIGRHLNRRRQAS